MNDKLRDLEFRISHMIAYMGDTSGSIVRPENPNVADLLKDCLATLIYLRKDGE